MKKLFPFLILPLILFFGCTSKKQNNELIIFHAGSVSAPLKEIIKEFNKTNPDVKILTEAAGSVECARKITDLKKDCDIIISADYKVIEKQLFPDNASWHIPFSSNEMTVVFTDKSKRANEINKTNWKEILADQKVSIGRSDPNSDPCGYRTLLTLQLTDSLSKTKGFFKTISEKSSKNIRPKETDLIALLETGAVDYIFLYKSVAIQHKFKYIELPDSVNLKQIALNNWYKTTSTEIRGKKPGEIVKKSGEAMIYAVSIIKNSKNTKLAEEFVDFFLSKGNEVFVKQGQPSVIPSNVAFLDSIPSSLQKYVSK